MNNVQDFHDATLLNLSFDWGLQKLECVVKPVSKDGRVVKIFFDDVSKYILSFEHPWGKSSSINTVTKNIHEDRFLYAIEMQSGDVIEIYARNMYISEY